ncbi:LamG-like jellyroll fold domain-containing protein [Jiangella muralis]|uniref:LamG-like jellyroll fold domain-containing protein n=1 Tax=Jiangella muralis TaxID=702383 RepID=UPI00069DDBCA|nr:LamG-like jellyroll fold domain-containing protein [Jiangella muralis]
MATALALGTVGAGWAVPPSPAGPDDHAEAAGPMAPPLGGDVRPRSVPLTAAAESMGDGQEGALTLPEHYADRVDHALEQGADHWGERLLALPNGPTLENVKPLLVPVNHGGPTVAESPWYYLPLTYPAPDPHEWSAQRDFSLHVADGSELLSQWSDARASQRVTFAVGPDGEERFGAAEARSDEPELRDGYLPILLNRYTDAQGVAYERESFTATLEPGGPLVSMIRFTADASGADGAADGHLRVSVDTAGVDGAVAGDGQVSVDGKVILAYSGDATWASPSLDVDLDLSDGPASVYLIVANEPADLPGAEASETVFEQTREQVSEYWRTLLESGAQIELPESYAADAMRNTLLTNLVMGFNLTVGNAYEEPSETFAFVPEVAATVTSLGDFGYEDRFRENLDELMDRGQGGAFFTTWERGIKMQVAANHYLQTKDGSLIEERLETFESWRAEFARQRDADPHGLLAKARYASDIPEPVYGIHHQSEAWRGMRDLGVALRLMGRSAEADAFTQEADELQDALVDAIDRSKTTLPDGTIFVPIGLLHDNPEQPYERLTDTTLGSYWNLIMPYALATGILPPDEPTATGLREYLNRHGSMFLGMVRFNLAGGDPGMCHTKGAPWWPSSPGYKSTGIDQQYGYSLGRFLADSEDADRLGLSFYGMLAHNFTPNTFVAGEGATVSPCPQLGEYYRSQYLPPLSPNNATYLKALRLMLVREDVDSAGLPTELHIAPATPRDWLRDGERFAVRDLPSSFGPIAFEVTSNLDDGSVTARIEPPAVEEGRASAAEVTVHLRAPAGHRLTQVTVDGASVPFDAASESVRLGAVREPVTVEAGYETTPVSSASYAAVASVDPERTLVEPGETVELELDVEALGPQEVRGIVDVEVPAGWSASRSKLRFDVDSAGELAWTRLPLTVTVPRGAAPGSYELTLVTKPYRGAEQTATVDLRVAVPADGSYADLVEQAQPVGFWRFDETDAREAVADSSGSGNTGEFRGQVQTSEPGAVAGDPSSAVRLVNGYIDIPDSSSLSLTGPYTLEAWVKATAGGQQGLVEKYESDQCLPSRDGYGVRLVAGNKLQPFSIAGDQYRAGAASERSVRQVVWQHVASVYDGTTLRTYIDGRLQSETALSTAPTDGGGSLKVGARGDGAADLFEGWIDEVAVYDTALSADQLDAHYVKGILGTAGERDVQPAAADPAESLQPAGPAAQAAPGEYAAQVMADQPVGYWRLGESSGTVAQDASGTSNNGTYTGAVMPGHPGGLAGDPDTAAQFMGGYVSVPDSESLSPTGQFTLEAWVNLDDVCGQYGLVEKYDAPAFNGYLLRVTPGGRLSAFTLGGDGQLASVTGQSVVMPDEWHHVVAVYDGTSLSVYLDGELDGSVATTFDPVDGMTDLKLGARGDDAGARLRGVLDEVAVYDHALTAERVQQHYTLGRQADAGG